ncbi:MAG TPA: hypothetical protein VMP89_16810, partial [Solirubrobacteraceae bacterium]|nr:hypothetical protein [Solirubrobacteraceae bacterium]
RIGSSSVLVSATDRGLSLRAASWTWKVQGAPTVSRVSLSGVGSGHPALALTVTAGNRAPDLASVSIGLPRGLNFGSTAHNLRVTGPNGARVAFSSRIVAGRLRVTLAKPALRIRIAIGGSAIRASGGLVANVRGHRGGALTVTITTTDAGRHSAATSARIRPRG